MPHEQTEILRNLDPYMRSTLEQAGSSLGCTGLREESPLWRASTVPGLTRSLLGQYQSYSECFKLGNG